MSMSISNGNLNNIIEKKSLKWIFVGGKGGVGKTTVSSSLAVQLSKYRNKVLIVSTDPAHNLSDAFNQKFNSEPTNVSSINNLFACEIDPKMNDQNSSNDLGNVLGYTPDNQTMGIFSELSKNIPGIDEAMSLGYIMKLVENGDYDCVVFDTAPTGHTLRLLSFPNLLENGLEKMLTFREKINSLVQTFGMFGGMNFEQAFEKLFFSLSSLKENIERLNTQFKDNVSLFFIRL